MAKDVIPALLQPYMTLLCETEGLRDINSRWQLDGCVGCSDGWLLNVTCVYFESMLIFTCVFIVSFSFANIVSRIGEDHTVYL